MVNVSKQCCAVALESHRPSPSQAEVQPFWLSTRERQAIATMFAKHSDIPEPFSHVLHDAMAAFPPAKGLHPLYASQDAPARQIPYTCSIDACHHCPKSFPRFT